MNFIADEGVDMPIVHALRRAGHNVWYIAEMGAGTSDEDILALANAQNAPLLTNDKDFGALVFQQRRATAGVILLRLAGLSNTRKAALVSELVTNQQERLIGSFTVITPRRVRIRPAKA